MSDLDLHAMCV